MTKPHSPTNQALDSLARAFLAATPSMGDFERQLSLLLYKQLSSGNAVAPTLLATQLNTDSNAVVSLLRNWPGVYFDEEDNVIGYWGLTIKPMPHQLQIADKTLYTWCAWDGLFIPELLHTAATFTTHCPITQKSLMIHFNHQGAFDTDHPDMVMSFVKSYRGIFASDVIAQFCHYIYLFKNRGAATEWLQNQPETLLLSLDEAIQLGHLKNRQQYQLRCA